MMKKFPLFLLAASILIPISACAEKDGGSETSAIKVTGISLNESTKTLEVGDTFQLEAIVTPDDASNKSVRYSSADTSIAKVNSTGLVTAYQRGSTKISVITNDGNHFAQCKIIVTSNGVAPDDIDDSDPINSDTVIPDTPVTLEPTNYDIETPHDVTIQDNTVLHCWNWSMNTIKNNLNDIANAGFKTIQLSPMQPQKDYYNGGSWEGQWWKLYQPLGFSIAQNGQNVLGTKEELRQMCEAAENKGIKVIVDVVANHLAGGGDTFLNGSVRNFEPEIYDQNLIHTLGDKTKAPGYDSNSEYILRGAIGGFPDLQTENPVVQNRVLSLLKEYIDVGVDGFRFDAAKHIETPDDGELASNFWPTVLNGATSYAHDKNLPTPYYYGEILTTPGTKRDFEWYTKFMSVTDSEEGGEAIAAVEKKNELVISNNLYKTALPANKLMLWGESHDTFANELGSTRESESIDVNKAYCIQASRKDASSLYFARPNAGWGMGSIGSTDYKSAEIKAANEFHNKIMFSPETIHSSNGCFINERGTKGIAIIGISNSSNQVTIDLNNIKSGSYINLVNNQTISASNKKITVTLINGVAFLIRSDI